MRRNTKSLVHNEQKPKQRKDRKYNNNMKKAGRVQGSTQRMTCPVKKSTIRLGSKSVYKSSPIEAILQGIYIKSCPGGQLKK